MVSASVLVRDPLGLHLRPAGELCTEARKYRSSVKLATGHSLANAKSMLSVLGAQIRFGDTVTFTCEGSDEQKALHAMIAFMDRDTYDEA